MWFFWCVQVTLEEQMICGALQTLNEEACEDVLEETEEAQVIIDQELPQTTVIPPSPDCPQGECLLQSIYKKNSALHIEKSSKKVTYKDEVKNAKDNSGRAFQSRSNPAIYVIEGDS